MELIGTAEQDAWRARREKINAAIAAAERLFRSAADELASARHNLSEGMNYVADSDLKESAKEAADAMSILQLLPDVTDPNL
jgi:ABC-type transporter Mla subunit MlaD